MGLQAAGRGLKKLMSSHSFLQKEMEGIGYFTSPT